MFRKHKQTIYFFSDNTFWKTGKGYYICNRNEQMIAVLLGGMAEWSIAAVLKTVDCNRSGGSNPSSSAK